MKPKIILTFVYLLLITLLLVLIVQKYEASVTGRFYFVGAHDKATFNPECRNIKIIASDKYNQPLFFKDKTVYVNLKLVDKLKMPVKYAKIFNTSKPPILYKFDKNRSNIVVVGDSYTEGCGVKYNQSYPYYLSKDINKNVINLGVGGYNTKLELERFKEIGLKYHPKLIIWQYCYNDYEDTNQFQRLLYNVFLLLKKSHYDCNEDKISGNPIFDKTMRLYYRFFVDENKDKMIKENILEPLSELQNMSKNLTMLFIIVSPQGMPYFLTNFTNQHNVITIDVTKDLNFTGWKPPFTVSKLDWHFSPRTNKELADLLAKKIKEVLK